MTGAKERILQPWNLALYSIPVVSLIFLVDVFDPFNLPKLAAIVSISAGVLAVAVGNGNSVPRRRFLELSKFEKLILSFLWSFLISYGISGLISTETKVRFLFGTTARNLGFLYYLALVIICTFLVLARFHNLHERLSFNRVILFTFFPMSLYALLQSFERDPIKWNNPFDPMIATLGNPNFSSALFGCLSGYFLAFLLFERVGKGRRLVHLLALVVSVVATLLNSSVQGKLLLLIAVILLVSRFLLSKAELVTIKIAYLSTVVIGGTLVTLSFIGLGPLGSSFEQPTIKLRYEYWRVGILSGLSRPISGVGVDSYQEGFHHYRSANFANRYSLDVVSDNAHNWFIQIFATSGVFAFFFFMIVVIPVLLRSMKILLFEKEIPGFVLAAATLFILFFSQALISIEQIGLGIWFWVTLALMTNNTFFTDKLPTTRHSNLKGKGFGREASFLVVSLFAILSFRVIQEDSNFGRLLVTKIDANTNPTTIDAFVEDFSQFTLHEPKRVIGVANAYFLANWTQKGLEILETMRELDPGAWEPRDALALAYGATGNNQAAILNRLELIQLDPNHWRNVFELAKLYELEGEREKSLAYFEMVVELSPYSEEGMASMKKLKN